MMVFPAAKGPADKLLERSVKNNTAPLPGSVQMLRLTRELLFHQCLYAFEALCESLLTVFLSEGDGVFFGGEGEHHVG